MIDATEKKDKWIVAMQQEPAADARTIGDILKLEDPRSGDLRDYALMSLKQNTSEKYIAEFQILPLDFSAFIIGRHIVKDGDLYLINRIDPLFFYLPTQALNDGQEPKKHSWQPHGQFLEQSKLPMEVTNLISEEQLRHICSTFDNEEIYFKFNVDRALKWLQKKQERILKILVSQAERRRDANERRFSSFASSNGDKLGGSVSSNFNCGKPVGVVTPPSSAHKVDKNTSELENKEMKIESLQIVCNYLNDTWSTKFVEHMGFSMDQVMNTTKNKTKDPGNVGTDKINLISSGALTEDDLNGTREKKAVAEKKAREASRTAGNKRLAKVNTKGMKSIASFFGVAKKAKR